MIEFAAFLILAFAAYRITRVLLFDSLFEHSRDKLYVRLANASTSSKRRKAFLADKALEGLSCSWCTGVWVCFGVYWFYTADLPTEWGRLGWITFAGLAGVQGLLHAWEPGDDD